MWPDTGIIHGMMSLPDALPNGPDLLKQMLRDAVAGRQSDQDTIAQLQEQVTLLRQRLFGRKSEQSSDPDSPQLGMFNEAESLANETPAEDDEETVAPVSVKKRGKRKPLPAELPRVEVVHELPEHELTCDCGCRKQAIGEETSEQLEIIPMQIRVIRHIRKVYACKGCEAAPVTADKPAQLIEKSMASPSVLAMPGCGMCWSACRWPRPPLTTKLCCPGAVDRSIVTDQQPCWKAGFMDRILAIENGPENGPGTFQVVSTWVLPR